MMSCSCSRSIIRRTGSPAPRPPGSFEPSSVKTLPLVEKTSSFDVVSAKKESFSRSSVLKARPVRSCTWPLRARIQPFSETTTVIGSRSTSASVMASMSTSAASPKVVRRLPSGVSLENCLRTLPISQETVFHCMASEPSSFSMPCFSLVSSSCSLRSSISSSLASERRRMLRIASTCTSVRSNRATRAFFGSSAVRMMWMTSSMLR